LHSQGSNQQKKWKTGGGWLYSVIK